MPGFAIGKTTSLGLCRFLLTRQAVNIGSQNVNPVIALQCLLSRHLALAAITNGLLQLSEAGTVDKRTGVGQVRRAEFLVTLGIVAVA